MADKEVTIYDIAKALNISAATVSRGLKDHASINKETRRKVFHTAQEMGYRFNSFASNLRRQQTNTIGVIVPRLNSNFMADVLAGIEKQANEAGYNLIISQSMESKEKEISNVKTMFNNRVDGLLVSLAYNTEDAGHFREFINRGIPVIFFDRVFDQETYPQISIDNFQAGYKITSHLAEQGCKNIAHITGNLLRNVYNERFRGYLQALKDHNLSYREENLIINNLSLQEGAASAEQILALDERPDAVFAANDLCAVGCMLVLQKHGIRIPEDMAFAGFNNDQMSTVIEPNLTTINYRGYEMGEAASEVLINHLKNKNIPLPYKLTLSSELIIRNSSLKKLTNQTL